MLQQLHDLTAHKTDFIFDFDKTIAQIEIDWSGWFDGMAEVFAEFEDSDDFGLGEDPHVAYNRMVEKYGAPLATRAEQFMAAYEAEHLTGFTPNEELIEFIQQDTSVTKYVFSSNARPTVLRGLEELDIDSYFETIVTRTDVMRVKPDPEGFVIFEGLPARWDDFVMVGDSDSDAGAAEQAGIEFVRCERFERFAYEK